MVLLWLLLLTSCQPVSTRSSLEKVVDDGVLKIGTIFGRTTFYHGSEAPRGFEFELARGFASYLGVEVQIYPFYSYQALMKELEQGRVDVVAAGDAVPKDFARHFKLGPVYQQVSHKLVFLQGQERPRDIDDLTAFACCDHFLGHSLAEEEKRFQIDIHHRIPVFFCEVD